MIHDMNQDKDQVKDAWLIMKAHGKEEDQEVHLLGHEVTGMVNSEISRIVNSNFLWGFDPFAYLKFIYNSQ